MRKRAPGYLAWAILFSTAWGGERARDPYIHSVEPHDLREGTLVRITGTDFREQGARDVLLMSPGMPGRPIPAGVWSPSLILALVRVADCAPGQYQLGIRMYAESPFVRYVERGESNTVPVRVMPPAPPARAGREEDKKPEERDPAKLGRPHIRLVHPVLCSIGEELNLYGAFPFPDTSYRVVLLPGARLAASQAPGVRPQVLPPPLEITGMHVRVRLPTEAPYDRLLHPGENFLRIDRGAGRQQGNEIRIIIRSTRPREWEHVSHMRYGGAVACRLEAAVWKVGPRAQYMDILGRGFGPNERDRFVHLVDATQLWQAEQSLRNANNPTAPLYPVAPALRVASWSETRIRVSTYISDWSRVTGPHFAYIRLRERNWPCSNPVQVVGP